MTLWNVDSGGMTRWFRSSSIMAPVVQAVAHTPAAEAELLVNFRFLFASGGRVLIGDHRDGINWACLLAVVAPLAEIVVRAGDVARGDDGGGVTVLGEAGQSITAAATAVADEGHFILDVVGVHHQTELA